MWLTILALLLAVMVVLYFLGGSRLKKNDAKLRADLLEVFGDAGISLPTLEFGSSFDWPTFTVTFRNKEDLAFAKRHNLTDSFKSRIQSFYSADFEADRAVTFTYEGHRYF